MTRDDRQGSLYRIGRALGVAVATYALALACATEARAACFTTGLTSTANRPELRYERANVGGLSGAPAPAGQAGSIVGLWRVAFLVGDGPDVAYEGFQQWHDGGTEAMVDNGVPPAFGNVCLGVWKKTGPRTFALRHVTFNWDEQARSTGTFEVLITVRLSRTGNTYAGRYVADSFDLEGNVIPEAHAEGRLRGTRLTVE